MGRNQTTSSTPVQLAEDNPEQPGNGGAGTARNAPESWLQMTPLKRLGGWSKPTGNDDPPQTINSSPVPNMRPPIRSPSPTTSHPGARRSRPGGAEVVEDEGTGIGSGMVVASIGAGSDKAVVGVGGTGVGVQATNHGIKSDTRAVAFRSLGRLKSESVHDRSISSRSGRPPSPKTVHNIHLTLHRALEDAVEDGLIDRNPTSGARRAPTSGPEMMTWNAGQLRAFFLATAGDRHFPLWRLTAMTGMRRGEVLGLRWDDVDFEASTVTVNRQRSRGERAVVVSPPKTDRGRRTIDIDEETASVLREWRRRQLEERVAYQGGWQDTELIFTRKNGSPLDPDVLSQRFNRRVQLSGLPDVRFHDLRHTHATLLLLAGVPAHVVSMRLGHRSVAFTLQQHAHVLPQQQADAVERLAAKLLGEP